MKVYVDTNFLVRLYLELPGCEEALKLIKGVRRAGPCPITRLLRFEVLNAIERMVFESRTGGGRWRVTPESAALAVADFEQDLGAAQFLAASSLTLEDIESEYEALVARYTAKHGFRTYDVMHVAPARTMNCTRFLTFDQKVKSLAKLAGLKTN